MDTAVTQKFEKVDETEKEMAGKELGEEIERLRLKAGWSQVDLAHRIGLHQTRVSKIEKGVHNFPLETVYRLALAFNVSPFELAAIYWGIRVEDLQNKEKELLDIIIKLVESYRAAAPTTLPNPLRQLSAHDDAFAQGVIQQRRRPAAKGKDKDKGKGKGKTGELGKEQEQEDSKSSDEEI